MRDRGNVNFSTFPAFDSRSDSEAKQVPCRWRCKVQLLNIASRFKKRQRNKTELPQQSLQSQSVESNYFDPILAEYPQTFQSFPRTPAPTVIAFSGLFSADPATRVGKSDSSLFLFPLDEKY